MSIDEAIARERKMVKIYKNNIIPKENYHNMPWIDKNNEVNMRSVEAHEQIAEWLEELKAYREIGTVEGYKSAIECYTEEYTRRKSNEQYNKAIDDFVKEICKMIVQSENNGNYRFYAIEIKQAIADMAEQLKAGGENV